MATLKQLLQAYRANVDSSLKTEFDGELWNVWWNDGSGDYPDAQGITSEVLVTLLQKKLVLHRDTLQRSIGSINVHISSIDEVLKTQK